jgi:hypothetical protein
VASQGIMALYSAMSTFLVQGLRNLWTKEWAFEDGA